jgi:hypothetical protein
MTSGLPALGAGTSIRALGTPGSARPPAKTSELREILGSILVKRAQDNLGQSEVFLPLQRREPRFRAPPTAAAK